MGQTQHHLLRSSRRSRFEISVFATFAVLHLPGVAIAVSRPGPPGPAATTALVSVVASSALWCLLTVAAVRAGRRHRQVPRTPLALAFAVDTVVLTVSGLSPPRPGNITVAAIGILAICAAAALLTRPRLLPLVLLPAVAGQTRLLWAADVAAGTSRLVADVATVTAVSVATTALITWLEHERRDSRAALLTAALSDPLTGLLNRRGLSEGLPALQRRRGARQDPPRWLTPTRRARTGADPALAPTPREVVVVVVDIDHFKAVNDRRGHDVGDAVLVCVAQTMRDCSRADDLLVRLGGEELAWVATWPSTRAAVAGAERLRALVAERTGALGEPVTISAGVAAVPQLSTGAGPLSAADAADALGQALTRADRALYRAKSTGRDRVTVAPATPPAPSTVSR